ncbi:MAG: hypothetical protein R3C03_12420 [Pirellulaceae bacterium]
MDREIWYGTGMTDLPSTRQSLLLELGRSDNAAWSEFLHVYEKAIVGYCIRRGLQEADAMDAAQEVYTAIQQKWARGMRTRAKAVFALVVSSRTKYLR